jgi:hypothetical protein
MASVTRAIDGAALNIPEKRFGLKASLTSENADTIEAPKTNRIARSAINFGDTLRGLQAKIQ